MLTKEPIAIVGFDSILPGEAKTPESFFDMLLEGRSARSKVPGDRYNVDAFYHPDYTRVGTIRTQHGHFMQHDIAAFDAPFFSMTPAQAAALDPQQRGLLETTYRALENAGIPLDRASGSNTSVFVGNFTRDSAHVMAKDPEVDYKYMATGMDGSMLSSRLSWFYNFKGPSMTVETACSSSLTSCHLACQSLNAYESSMSIVGGCNLIFAPEPMIHLSGMRFLSPDGISYSFDERANGYSRGEGFAILVLKRLSDALRDNDTIRAVIRNTACNQDGRTPSITQPSKEAQINLIHQTYEEVGLDPSSTKYFEAHATGTAVGDPIEMAAINEVFSKHRSAQDPMYVGAVKTNIGHLEGAAGIAGLLKSIYVLEQGVIPGNIWFKQLNPKITIDKDRFRFPVGTQPWASPGIRRASINGFGFGGTNVHVVLDDARSYLESHGLEGTHCTIKYSQTNGTRVNGPSHGGETNETSTDSMNGFRNGFTNGFSSSRKKNVLSTCNRECNGIRAAAISSYRLFVLSAADEGGVQRTAQAQCDYLHAKRDLIKDEALFLDDLSYTLSQRRTRLPWRTAVVADSVDTLVAGMKAASKPVHVTTGSTVNFVFTGQGAQWPQMGNELLAYPTFKESLQSSGRYLRKIGCDWDLIEEISKTVDGSIIDDPEMAQPITTALQLAIVDLLASWSVHPRAVIGHSSGEIAAACTTGAISKEAALRIAYFRGILSSSLANSKRSPEAGMLAVALGPEDVASYLEQASRAAKTGLLAVACINSPVSVTVSGATECLEKLAEILSEQNIFSRKLRVKNGFHSQYMSPIADDYRRLIGTITPRCPEQKIHKPAFYSSSKGNKLGLEELQKSEYWVGNLLSPVLFSSALTSFLSESGSPTTNLLEIGPHAALGGSIREIAQVGSESKSVGYISVLRRGSPADHTALEAAGWLFSRGLPVHVSGLTRERTRVGGPRTLTDLPRYSFNHSRTYWNESRISKSYRFRNFTRHDLLGAPVPDWNPANAVWFNRFRVSENPWITHHALYSKYIFPAAGIISLVVEACKQLAGPEERLRGFNFQDLSFKAPFIVPNNSEGIEVRLYLRPSAESGWSEFEFWSHEKEAWECHYRGRVQAEPQKNQSRHGFEEFWSVSMAEVERSGLQERNIDQIWGSFEQVGLRYGSVFRTLSDLHLGPEKTTAVTVIAPDLKSVMPHGYVHSHLIHPVTLHGAMLAASVAFSVEHITEATTIKSIKELWVSADQRGSIENMRVFARAGRGTDSYLVGADPVSRKPLLTARGLAFTTVPISEAVAEQPPSQGRCFALVWKPDTSFLQQKNASRTFGDLRTSSAEAGLMADLETLRYIYLKRFADRGGLNLDNVDPSQSHYPKYISWIQHVFDLYKCGQLPSANPNWDRWAQDNEFVASLEERLQEANPEGKMTVAVGRLLPDILTGKISPLEVLFSDKLVENAYRNQPGAEYCFRILSRYMDQLAHKNPHLKILEIGAGTGSATKFVVNALTQGGEHGTVAPRFSRYDFTDISTVFLQKAKEMFRTIGNSMEFGILDIEKEPAKQGYEYGRYDAIIAANVLHATKSLDVTLKHVRMLLKPGGKLILYEGTIPNNICAGFTFGLLSGWWLHEEPYRKWSPLLSIDEWDSHLRSNGFSGVDISFDDFLEPANHQHSVMVATAIPEQNGTKSPALAPAVVIFDASSPFQTALAKLLEEQIEMAGIPRELAPLGTLKDVCFKKKVCVFLPELETSFFEKLDDASFAILQGICGSAAGILWLTQGGGPKPTNPKADMVVGFSRAMRSDNPTLEFITLSFERVSSAEMVKDSTWKLLEKIFFHRDNTILDNTFYEADNVTYIPRVVQESDISSAIKTRLGLMNPQTTSLSANTERHLTLHAASPGSIESLYFVDDPRSNIPLGDSEVELRVEACAISAASLETTLGATVGPGCRCDATGTVTRVGRGAKFKEGDRVCGLILGAAGTYVRARSHTLTKVADHLNATSAAYFPTVFATAYAALYKYGNIQKGTKVLIHGGSHGVGQACIQLAQLADAEVFVTVNSEEQQRAPQGIPESHVLEEGPALGTKIMKMTDNQGVDVVVNSLFGTAVDSAWECIAPFGRFIDLRSNSVDNTANLTVGKLRENVFFTRLDILGIATRDEAFVERILGDAMDLVRHRKLRALRPPHVYSWSKIQDAFAYLQTTTQMEGVVLQMREDDEIIATPKPKSIPALNTNATYVLCGELGKFGHAVCRWMAKRGAKNLLYLPGAGPESRSERAIEDLASEGVKVVTLSCDISDEMALKQVVTDCSARLLPVKGWVQFMMGTSLDNVSATALGLGLEKALPSDVDFFVSLSSSSGLTGKGERVGLCMSNVFLDAFARHRVSLGQRAAVLALNYVSSDGEVGSAALQEITEFWAVMDEVCSTPWPPSPAHNGQVILGLQKADELQDNGKEIPSWMSDPLFNHLHLSVGRVGSNEPSTTTERVNYQSKLRGAKSLEAAAEIISSGIVRKICQILKIEVQVDISRPLYDYGVDSLVAVELRTWFKEEMGAEIAMNDIVGQISLKDMASLLASRSSIVSAKRILNNSPVMV